METVTSFAAPASAASTCSDRLGPTTRLDEAQPHRPHARPWNWVRYPIDVDVICWAHLPRPMVWTGKVLKITSRGIAFACYESIDAGAVIAFRLMSAYRPLTCMLEARVTTACQDRTECWHVTCEFVRELDDPDCYRLL